MRVSPSITDSLPTVPSLHALPVVVGNLVPIAGVLFFGWSPTALLLVYQAELAAICVWTILKVPFAHKRPNNAIDDRFRLLGPLQEKRGTVGLPGPLPPVYPRNVPTLVFSVIISPVVVGLAFVAFALTRPTVTEADAAAFLLGGAAVFLTRGIDTYREYFRGNGYREHSPRSLLLVPFKYLFVVGLLFMASIPRGRYSPSRSGNSPTTSGRADWNVTTTAGAFSHGFTEANAPRSNPNPSRHRTWSHVSGHR